MSRIITPTKFHTNDLVCLTREGVSYYGSTLNDGGQIRLLHEKDVLKVSNPAVVVGVNVIVECTHELDCNSDFRFFEKHLQLASIQSKIKIGDKVKVILSCTNDHWLCYFCDKGKEKRLILAGDEIIVQHLINDGDHIVYEIVLPSGNILKQVIKSRHVVLVSPQTDVQPLTCTCSRRDLMISGCICGYLSSQRKVADV